MSDYECDACSYLHDAQDRVKQLEAELAQARPLVEIGRLAIQERQARVSLHHAIRECERPGYNYETAPSWMPDWDKMMEAASAVNAAIEEYTRSHPA